MTIPLQRLSEEVISADGSSATTSESGREAAPTRWHSYDDVPEEGRKIVGLYSDGSGALLFYVHAGGLLDEEGEDAGELGDREIWTWAYLPKGFRLWCEIRADEPLTLPDGGDTSSSTRGTTD